MKKLLPSIVGSSLLTVGVSLLSAFSSAEAFTLTATLTGDIRDDNPDNLFVNVTIVSGQDGVATNEALWTIDINASSHPGIKLDEFYFNLADSISSNVAFSGFNPLGWTVASPANVQGAGGTTFQFEALEPSGPPNAADVTNAQNLSFLMTYNGENLTANDFLNAPTSSSNDAGSGQLGAHLQSLDAEPGQSDSGFAFGDYEGEGEPQETTPEVPEPSALLGLIVLSTIIAGSSFKTK